MDRVVANMSNRLPSAKDKTFPETRVVAAAKVMKDGRIGGDQSVPGVNAAFIWPKKTTSVVCSDTLAGGKLAGSAGIAGGFLDWSYRVAMGSRAA